MLDPAAAALLAQLEAAGLRDFPDLGVTESRAALALFPRLQGESMPMANVADLTIPSPDGDIPARMYVPTTDSPLPLLVYFHGGGFVVGDIEVADRPCRELASTTGTIVISVDYRLAPEHPAPAPLNDAYAAVTWAAQEGEGLGGDGRLCVAGDSAGGNLAATVALLARDRGGPRIDTQLLLYPITDMSKELPSRAENGEGYLLTARGMRWFTEHYLSGGASPLDPTISPLLAPDLSGLPPAIVVTAGFDPLRDEGQAYAQRLLDSGVPVHHIENPTMIHGFLWMSAVLDRSSVVLQLVGTSLREQFAHR